MSESMQRSASMTLMPIQEMYNITTRQHAAWGLDGYEVPKKYFDHLKVVQDKIYEDIRKSGKATKNNKIVTKRGSYLEDEVKFRGQNPGPQKYDVSHKWVSDADIEKGKKLPKNTKKMTFIEQIFVEQERRKIPGPGKYNIFKTDEQIKAEIDKMNQQKIKHPERISYLQEYEYLSNTLPGPGNYNPRPILPKIHKDNMDPAKWISFHKAKSTKNAKSNLPDVGTYKMNYPLDYDTFGKMLAKEKEDANKKSSVRYMGTEERFKDPKKSKSKITQIVPGPGQYPLVAKWQGKEQKKDSKDKNWMNSITTGISKSIYYS